MSADLPQNYMKRGQIVRSSTDKYSIVSAAHYVGRMNIWAENQNNIGLTEAGCSATALMDWQMFRAHIMLADISLMHLCMRKSRGTECWVAGGFGDVTLYTMHKFDPPERALWGWLLDFLEPFISFICLKSLKK